MPIKIKQTEVIIPTIGYANGYNDPTIAAWVINIIVGKRRIIKIEIKTKIRLITVKSRWFRMRWLTPMLLRVVVRVALRIYRAIQM